MLDHQTLQDLGWSKELIQAFTEANQPPSVTVTFGDYVSSLHADPVLISDKLLVADAPPIGDNRLWIG